MSTPLFDRYPSLVNKVPYLPLADLPTSIEPLHFDDDAPNDYSNLWIKRDDLSHKSYGGNKVRKLEFILAEAKSLDKHKVVTFGATGTNHGVATSLFCQQENLACKIYLFDQPNTKTVQSNLKLMQVFNAQLEHKGSLFKTALSFYLEKLLAKLKLQKQSYFLFAGGSNIAGCLAFVNAAFELKAQIDQLIVPEPDYIFCPVGSSATVAGLTLGCHLAGINSTVIGIRVAPSHLGIIPSCTPHTIQSLMTKTYRHLKRLDHSISRSKQQEQALPEIQLDNSHFGSGYGQLTKEGDQATALFSKAGITLEPTYTAKAAAAVLSHCNKHPEDKVLYWHTYNSADVIVTSSKAKISGFPNALQRYFSA